MPRLVSIDDVRARTQVPSLPDDNAVSRSGPWGLLLRFRGDPQSPLLV